MIRRRFFAGLIVLLPLAITYAIIKFLVNLMTRPFQTFVQDFVLEYGIATNRFWLISHEQAIVISAKVLVILCILVLLFVIGFISHLFAHRIFVFLSDTIVGKIPFIGRIYGACKDFTHALFSPKSGTFSQVALVPYPSKEHQSIGLVTSSFVNDILPCKSREIVSVLIPGTPNPTIGFVLLFPKEDVKFIDMTPQEAIRFIMSCGTSLSARINVIENK